ncbi:trp operon leader peptide [Salmonella enterica subsp. enterica serovar Cerro]|uniref:trp operon leader peptide n=1 Tax=Salmonella enterica TaxID=28901 RepID=A0A5Y3B9N0_SALER|nr:trp operon leader peptide [Salmonella enterica]EAW1650985.1 trp operon leader peptide [Salmonella enterica subsp. enterica]ECT0785223.1 trp operon leader peptide [Salmonella enterica subsp. enterica serovar Anatum]EDS4903812.1 trp operon leader peptide [Salmonella enterica subsp. enterica serovar Mbandaka]EAO5844089.1 trp operon leader peptide [Salmonella enterica subsp. enterica serovar Cerro]EAP2443558.1 trp operon leader peptide [Salmonella enterica subsp. enterica serovar Cerro]
MAATFALHGWWHTS